MKVRKRHRCGWLRTHATLQWCANCGGKLASVQMTSEEFNAQLAALYSK